MTVSGWHTTVMTLDLTSAAVVVRSSDVVLRFETSGLIPDGGTLVLSTTLLNEAGDEVSQLGFKFLDARLIAVFSFDHVSNLQRNYPSVTPGQTGSTWTIVFPLEAIGDIRTGHWRAVATIEGADVATVEGEF